MRSAVIFTLFVFIFCVAAESGPRIVTSRTVLNHELIIGRDTIVNVEIFNVGDEYDFLIFHVHVVKIITSK